MHSPRRCTTFILQLWVPPSTSTQTPTGREARDYRLKLKIPQLTPATLSPAHPSRLTGPTVLTLYAPATTRSQLLKHATTICKSMPFSNPKVSPSLVCLLIKLLFSC